MDRLTLALLTFDVGVPAASPDAFADRVCAQVREAWDDGADLVVLPEFLWMGLEPFVAGEDKLRGVAQLFWADLWPRLSPRLAQADKGVVLGTVPFLGATASSATVRRSGMASLSAIRTNFISRRGNPPSSAATASASGPSAASVASS